MPARARIRYHAQRKHIVHSLDTLLYELHTLSFLLSPSLLILLCRCATQFQFARVRELDGRRTLAFWLGLVVLVNIGGVWAHAFEGVQERGKSVVLDFVGMGRKPMRFQLLLLDATIMFLQAILTTISYETSLALVMPPEVPDPLLPLPPPQSTTMETIESSSVPRPPHSPTMTTRSLETAPFLSYSSSSDDASSSSTVTCPPSRSRTYTPPPPPPLPPPPPPLASSSSSLLQESESEPRNPVPKDLLPPTIPIINLSLRHVARRLTSPVPESSSSHADGRGTDGGVLESEDDELAVLNLPFPNTTPVRLAHTIRLLAQARQRRREIERQEARRLRSGSSVGRQGRRRGEGGDGGESGGGGGGGGGRRESDARVGRIPGAIEEDEED